MDFKAVAEQLRKPTGQFGLKIAENMNLSNALINKWTINKLHAKANNNILEIGMANGLFVKELLQKNAAVRYSGVDFSQIMVDESVIRNSKYIKNGQAAFYCADAQKLPFADNTFDKAFTINTIYFWEEPAAVLAELSRVLKPGGVFIISIRPQRVMQNYPFTQYGFRLYSSQALSELLAENGFLVTEAEEYTEPDQQLGELVIKPESLIVTAQNNIC